MGVRIAEATERQPRPAAPPAGPGAAACLVVFVVALLLLLANGRPIGAPDAGGAAGWLWRGALALARSVLDLDATGSAILGKLLAAGCAALAAAALFAAVARRQPLSEARWAGLVLAVGTTLVSAAQAWSGEAAATAAVSLALWLMVRGELGDDGPLAARAGLPLALAAFCEPATITLSAVLAAAIAVFWPRAVPRLLVWAACGAAVGLAGALATHQGAVSPLVPARLSAAALLVSPAKGALVFAPVALVGLVGLLSAWRSSLAPRRWEEPRGWLLPVGCALGLVAHLATVTALGGWDQGVFWGPRRLAPAWPLLLLFLPEGLAATRFVGTALVVLSVAVQALGAVSYDGRWDRLYRAADGSLGRAAWDLAESPIAFQWREGVARPALLGVDGRRLVVREHALVRGSASGSFVTFGDGGLRPTGADATLLALRLEQGARVVGRQLELRAPGDGIAFRVREGARPRQLQLRLVGRGRGTLAFGEAGFWVTPRWRERTVGGPFRMRFPYAFADAHAADLSVVLRSGGPVVLDSVALVPPFEPEDVIRLP